MMDKWVGQTGAHVGGGGAIDFPTSPGRPMLGILRFYHKSRYNFSLCLLEICNRAHVTRKKMTLS